VPSVQDRKNALLLQPVVVDLSQQTLATVQHALLRGIESVFQLEEGEVLAEPLPSRDARSGFLLYEATEGGAGVLTRLVSEDRVLALVARTALRIMHFDLPPPAAPLSAPDMLMDLPGTACVAACYKCLMSYFNQPDHELIDRRNIAAREILLRLANSTTVNLSGQATAETIHPASESDDPLAAQWRAAAVERGLPAADSEPLLVDGHAVHPVWRSHYVAAALAHLPTQVTETLEDRGFEIVPFGGDVAAWPNSFLQLVNALGR
jgi:hypothetical protein